MRQKLLEAGASPLATEYPQSSLRDRHNCWDLAYRCTGMYDWLLEQSRLHNARQTQLFELLPADQILSAWQSHGPVRWKAEDDSTIRCRNAAADQPGYLISGGAYAACEFHVDVYLESASDECRLGLFNQATDDPLRTGEEISVAFRSAKVALRSRQGKAIMRQLLIRRS